MVEVSLVVDGDQPSVRILNETTHVDLLLDPQSTFEDGQALDELLSRCLAGVQIQSSDSLGSSDPADWHAHLVSCPCGRTFSDSGLAGLGKHASGCRKAQSALHVGSTNGSTVYGPVVEAIFEWNSEDHFTIPLLQEQFENVDVEISATALRGHIRWLIENNFLEVEEKGRNKVYRFTRDLPDLIGRETE